MYCLPLLPAFPGAGQSFLVPWVPLLFSILPAKPPSQLHGVVATAYSLTSLPSVITPSHCPVSHQTWLCHLIISSSHIDNSSLIISKSKLLCLTSKASIISPHPLYSILFPTKDNSPTEPVRLLS